MISYSHIFGPIFSKRLGFSLGIDPLGKKICSFNCVYCEISKTEILTLVPDKYVSIDRIFFELDYFFLFHQNIDIDYITLSGKGEPTLHSQIDEIIDYLHLNYAYPVCILTNSSLLPLKSIRKKILKSDVIMPSLNAISKKVYKNINLHHKEVDVDQVIAGIFDLKKEFNGHLCLEILFVKGLNDHDEEINLLKNLVKELQPDDVYINTIYRPPAFKKFQAIDSSTLNSLNTEFKNLLESTHNKENRLKKNTGFNKDNLNFSYSYDDILKKLKIVLYIRPTLKKDLIKILNSYGYTIKKEEWEKMLQFFLDNNFFIEKQIGQNIYIYLNNF